MLGYETKEWVGCWTFWAILNIDLGHDLDLGFSDLQVQILKELYHSNGWPDWFETELGMIGKDDAHTVWQWPWIWRSNVQLPQSCFSPSCVLWRGGWHSWVMLKTTVTRYQYTKPFLFNVANVILFPFHFSFSAFGCSVTSLLNGKKTMGATQWIPLYIGIERPCKKHMHLRRTF